MNIRRELECKTCDKELSRCGRAFNNCKLASVLLGKQQVCFVNTCRRLEGMHMWQGNVDMEEGHKWSRCITCRAFIRAEWQSITCGCGQINKYGRISAARVGNIYKYKERA